MIKWLEILSRYKYIVISVGIAMVAVYGGYLTYGFLNDKENQKEESLIYQYKSKLVQVEKKHGGAILDKASQFLSAKKVKDYKLIENEVNNYTNFLKSRKNSKPVHWIAAIELSYFLIKYDREKQALQLLESISLQKSDENWLYQLLVLKLGSMFMEEKNYTRAVHLFSIILSEESAQPFHLEAWFKTALCYESLGENEKAKEIYSLIQEKQEASLYKDRATHYNRLLQIKQKINWPKDK